MFYLFGLPVICAAEIYSTGGLYNQAKHLNVPLMHTYDFVGETMMQQLPSNVSSYYLNSPIPGNQGSQGSCSGWAVGYAAMSVLAYQKYGQDWLFATMSPSFVYNQVKVSSDCNSGAYLVDALELVKEQGVCRLDEMPYNEYDCSNMPGTLQLLSAEQNKISYARVDEKNIVEIKGMLLLGYPIVFGFYVTSSFYEMLYSNAIWYTDIRGDDDGYHFCCIVGYDDNRRLLKVQNSWGSAGDDGYFWISYDLVNQGVLKEAYVLYGMSSDLWEVSGPSSICREETYTIDGLPDGAEVQWTSRRKLPIAPLDESGGSTSVASLEPVFSLPLLVTEGQGTATATFEQNTVRVTNPGSFPPFTLEPFVGEAEIIATVRYANDSVTLTKDVYVQTTEHPEITLSLYPKPDIDVDSSFITHPGIGGGSIANPPLSNMASYEFSCANLEGHEDFQWTFVASNGTQVKDGRSVIVNHPAKGTLVVTLRHKDGCPDAAIATETYTVMGLRLLATNPASGSAEMQVVWDATPEGGTGAMSLSAVPTIPYEGEYEIELWDLLRGRLMVVEGEGGYTQFPLGGIPSGNYVLRLVIDGQQMDSLPLTVR